MEYKTQSKKRRLILIMGSPGVGKSTLANFYGRFLSKDPGFCSFDVNSGFEPSTKSKRANFEDGTTLIEMVGFQNNTTQKAEFRDIVRELEGKEAIYFILVDQAYPRPNHIALDFQVLVDIFGPAAVRSLQIVIFNRQGMENSKAHKVISSFKQLGKLLEDLDSRRSNQEIISVIDDSPSKQSAEELDQTLRNLPEFHINSNIWDVQKNSQESRGNKKAILALVVLSVLGIGIGIVCWLK